MIEAIKNKLQSKSITSILLLLSLAFFVFILPVLSLKGNILTIVLISVILFLAGYNISRRLVILCIVLIVIEITTRTTDFIYLNYVAMVSTNVFILYIVLLVILDMLAQKTVTLYTLLEAINGYLLIAIVFISLVGFVDITFPGSYLQTDDQGMNMVYYTLVTLTTVGYGDLTPQLPVAKSLSIIIAITGQFYIAVVVAIIVGKYASNK